MPPAAEWVTCSYCQVSSFVQRARSRAPEAAAIPAGTPVIHVRQSRSFVWVALVLLALATVAVVLLLFEDEKRLGSVAVVKPPLLFDVNDDGAEDVVMVASKVGGLTRHLRALDANTGETLWKTADLGKDVENVAIVGDAVLWIATTKLHGFDARTGRERFVADLPERPTGVCEAGRAWLLLTADKKVHALDPATGSLTPSPPLAAPAAPSAEPECTPAWSTFARFGRLVRIEPSPRVRVAGMTASTVLHFGEDTLPALALGWRTLGTALPMLAGMRDGQVLWKMELASSAPLEVKPGDPTAGTIAAGRAYASYHRTSSPGFTLVGVALSNGQRQWEVAVPRKRDASMTLRASERHVFVGADTALYALSATDGRLLWRVGWDPGAE